MNSLPQELCDEIASHLSDVEEDVTKNALVSLRLVNKAFAKAAAPILFFSIPLWLSLKSLERLVGISDDPNM